MIANLTLAAAPQPLDTDRFVRCLDASRRVRWDIDADVIRGRTFHPDDKFLPDGLSRVADLAFLDPAEQRRLTQVQGRTYANVLRLLERFVAARALAAGRGHWLSDPAAGEALARLGDETRKHQELFRRLDGMMGDAMLEALDQAYRFAADPDDLVRRSAGRSAWAVSAFTLCLGLMVQTHVLRSAPPDGDLSPLIRDVLAFHWREESQHTILDELEWRRIDTAVGRMHRERAVDDLLALVEALDRILRGQAEADARCFAAGLERPLAAAEAQALGDTLLSAGRDQFIRAGVEHPRFQAFLYELVTEAQRARIATALARLG